MKVCIIKKIVIGVTLGAFLMTNVMPSCAQNALALPAPGVMVALSPTFHPPVLKGITLHPEDPFKFDFILDKGSAFIQNNPERAPQGRVEGFPSNENLTPTWGNVTPDAQTLEETSKRLVKYFLSSVTTPEKDMWVNLSPYEKDRIIPDSFGQTDMGRDLLAQDYILKQITSSLMYPEGETGKKFWAKVYKSAYEKYGTTDIPIDTFNKVWIVPEYAKVYEHGNTAFVVNARMKVMLETDYLATSSNALPTGGHVAPPADQGERGAVSPSRLPTSQPMNARATQVSTPSTTTDASDETNTIAKQVIRDIVIPQLEQEVNEGANFAPLRQVYYSLILALWFKRHMKDSILGRKYVDQNKIQGIERTGLSQGSPEIIYQQYLQAFKQGVYNYIKEESDPLTLETLPRKYFSGGFSGDNAAAVVDYSQDIDASEVPNAQGQFRQLQIVFGTGKDNGQSPAAKTSSDVPIGLQNTLIQELDFLTISTFRADLGRLLEDGNEIYLQPLFKILEKYSKIGLKLTTKEELKNLREKLKTVETRRMITNAEVTALYEIGRKLATKVEFRSEYAVDSDILKSVFSKSALDFFREHNVTQVVFQMDSGYGTVVTVETSSGRFRYLEKKGKVDSKVLDRRIKEGQNVFPEMLYKNLGDRVLFLCRFVEGRTLYDFEEQKKYASAMQFPGWLSPDMNGYNFILGNDGKVKYIDQDAVEAMMGASKDEQPTSPAQFLNHAESTTKPSLEKRSRFQPLRWMVTYAQTRIYIYRQKKILRPLWATLMTGNQQDTDVLFKELRGMLNKYQRPVETVRNNARAIVETNGLDILKDFLANLDDEGKGEFIKVDTLGIISEIVSVLKKEISQETLQAFARIADDLQKSSNDIVKFSSTRLLQAVTESLDDDRFLNDHWQKLEKVNLLPDHRQSKEVVVMVADTFNMDDPNRHGFRVLSVLLTTLFQRRVDLLDPEVFAEISRQYSSGRTITQAVTDVIKDKLNIDVTGIKLELLSIMKPGHAEQLVASIIERKYPASTIVLNLSQRDYPGVAAKEVPSEINGAVSASMIKYLSSEAEIVFCLSAGNEGVPKFVEYPRFDNVLSIGALKTDGSHQLADYSNRGPHLWASIPALTMDEKDVGTSFAAPVAAGEIVRRLRQDTSIAARDVIRQIEVENQELVTGGGRVFIPSWWQKKIHGSGPDFAMSLKNLYGDASQKFIIKQTSSLSMQEQAALRDENKRKVIVGFGNPNIANGTGWLRLTASPGEVLAFQRGWKGSDQSVYNFTFMGQRYHIKGTALEKMEAWFMRTPDVERRGDVVARTKADGVLEIVDFIPDASLAMDPYWFSSPIDQSVTQMSGTLMFTLPLLLETSAPFDVEVLKALKVAPGDIQEYEAFRRQALGRPDMRVFPVHSHHMSSGNINRPSGDDYEVTGKSASFIYANATGELVVYGAREYRIAVNSARSELYRSQGENFAEATDLIQEAIVERSFVATVDSILSKEAALNAARPDISLLGEADMALLRDALIRLLANHLGDNVFRESIEKLIRPDVLNRFANQNGAVKEADLVKILQRLHTYTRSLYRRGLRKEVIFEDLGWFMNNSVYSHLDLLNVIESAGLAGNGWEQMIPDEKMTQYLKQQQYGHAWVYYNQAPLLDRVRLLKALVRHFNIRLRDAYFVLLLSAIRSTQNSLEAGKSFLNSFSGDMNVLLYAAEALKRQRDTQDLVIGDLLGRGADGMALKVKGSQGGEVVKINILHATANKPQLEERIALLDKVRQMPGIVRNNGLIQLPFVMGTNARLELIVEINQFVNGRELMISFEQYYATKDYKNLMGLIKGYVRLNKELKKRGFVNRDIGNLSNVLRERDGRLTLVDLGNIYAYEPLKDSDYRDDLARTVVRLLTGQTYYGEGSVNIDQINHLLRLSGMQHDPGVKWIVGILGKLNEYTFASLMDAVDHAMSFASAVNYSQAPATPGGIDLTDGRMKVDVAADNAEIPSAVDLKAMENMEINGLYIKHLELVPLNNLPQVLGIPN
ncbi:MAG: S8 family serine peptidase [Candidatus Omnitrophica bacterium]|nr:S8 family serine peptidase [Candidatus Omnitrophota bacterium]